MRFKLVIAGLGIILISSFVHAGWDLQHSGSNSLFDITFPPVDVNNGYACGANSLVLKTTNGGDSWVILSVAQPSGDFNAIIFPVTAEAGYIVCDSGNVQSTRDAGNNWRRFNVGTTNKLNSISFPKNNDTGYVVGLNGAIFRTADGGRSWFDLSLTEPVNLNGVHFANVHRGWVVGDNGTIYRTLDDGIGWQPETSNVTQQLFGIYFRDTTYGWVTGAGKTFLKTTNAGFQWNPIDLPLSNDIILYSVSFSSDLTKGFVCGSSGKIARTTNSGTTWDVTTVNPTSDLRAIVFPNPNHIIGWTCGSGEAIFKTTDGGTWIEETKPVDEVLKSTFTCSPNPFRSNTKIEYSSLVTNKTTLKIYDCSGGLVRSLGFNDRRIANWDGSNELKQRVKPGIYLVELKHNGISQRQKLIFMD